MSALSLGKTLRNGSSVLALSTIAMIGAEPALANPTDGIYGGGSTLASLTVRQVADCYANYRIPATTIPVPLPADPVAPPAGCTSGGNTSILLLYAGVGSGAGLRGYVSNDPKQLFRGSNLVPANNPRYFDSTITGTPLADYPYPNVDFGAGDSPLPANLVTGPANISVFTVSPSAGWTTHMTLVYPTRPSDTATVTVTANGIKTYPTASFGAPIQLPLFEAPVAIAVNLPHVRLNTTTVTHADDGQFYDSASGVTWTIKSQFAGDITTTAQAGGRIQLSTAQICAIFSGLVTDWNDNSSIAYLTDAGVVSHENFADANTWHKNSNPPYTPGTGGGTRYASVSTPITIVYRSDGSGTSFIFTNYLKTVCPLLDDGSNKYATIFGASNLPDNSFAKLISNVTAQGRTLHTVGADGSDAVAAAIHNGSYGYIGYLSNDFVAPFNPVTTSRPDSALVQNDWDRANRIYHPGDTGLTTQPHNYGGTPTPNGASVAWGALAAHGVTPATTWAFNDYNVYAKTFPATTYLPGSIDPVTLVGRDIGGRSILPLAEGEGAYPITGTAYLYVYSCYATAARAIKLVDFLNWYYSNTNSQNLVSNNGFGPLASNWVSNITTEYLEGYTVNTASTSIYDAQSTGLGCTGVTGGAQ